MANTTTSQFMLLPVPVPTIDPGPTFAFDLNTCLTIIDQHNHQPGAGVPINPQGMNINTDLSFGGNNATNLRSSRYTAQGSPLSGTLDLGCVYVSGADLYYNDTAGNKIRMTASGSVAGTAGSITGLVAPASVVYKSSIGTFIFQSSSATAATIDAGTYILRITTAGSAGISLSAPSNLTTNYTLTATSAPPAALSYVTMNNVGQLGFTSVPSANPQTLNYTIKPTDTFVEFTTTPSSAITATFPNAVGLNGTIITVKNVSFNASTGLNGTVSLASVAGQTFDNRPSGDIVLRSLDYATMISDNSNWKILSKVETTYVASSGNDIAFGAIGTGNYGFGVNNSVTLGIGKWRVSGYFSMFTPNTADINNFFIGGTGFYLANGNNTSTTPAFLPITYGPTSWPNNTDGGILGTGNTGINAFLNTSTLSFTCVASSGINVYLVPQVNVGTVTSTPILTPYIWAERIW